MTAPIWMLVSSVCVRSSQPLGVRTRNPTGQIREGKQRLNNQSDLLRTVQTVGEDLAKKQEPGDREEVLEYHCQGQEPARMCNTGGQKQGFCLKSEGSGRGFHLQKGQLE